MVVYDLEPGVGPVGWVVDDMAVPPTVAQAPLVDTRYGKLGYLSAIVAELAVSLLLERYDQARLGIQDWAGRGLDRMTGGKWKGSSALLESLNRASVPSSAQ